MLILNFTQFGYHTDSYMYARYADREKIELHYCCLDTGLKRIDLERVKVMYIALKTSRIKTYLSFFYKSKRYIRKEKFDLIFHVGSKFTKVLRLLNLFSPMVLDIRTGDLSDNRLRLWFRNKQITISTWLYRRVSVISESLSKELKINPRKTTIIPLGGERHFFAPKEFNSFRMLYVGSLNNRNIEQTILGFSICKAGNPELDLSYHIIGFGSKSVENLLLKTIEETGMSSFITFHGRKSISEVAEFLEFCNVGVVYVPQVRYYDFQPSTKFYESVLSGMPVIATNTLENRRSLKSGCGVLCEDNPDSFSNSLEKLIKEKNSYNSQKIIDAYAESDWKFIVSNIWEPFILEPEN